MAVRLAKMQLDGPMLARVDALATALRLTRSEVLRLLVAIGIERRAF
jgi:hypothetical protein